MMRTSILLLSLISILIVTSYSVPFAQQLDANPCVDCHFESYESAISNAYVHSVVHEDCEFCHIKDLANEELKSLDFTIDQEENLLNLGKFDNKKYQLKINDATSKKRNHHTIIVDIQKEQIEKIKSTSITQISNVKVEEVKKGPFVRATISWDTDVWANSGIEYTLKNKDPDRRVIDDIYTKKHRITLNRLKHKSQYQFKVVSKDIRGNELKSDQYMINTSKEFTHNVGSQLNPPREPCVDNINVVEVDGIDGLCMLVSAKRPTKLNITINEIKESQDVIHGSGLTAERFLTIDVCYECHQQNASHPVNIKPQNSKVTIPDDLPTIEDGILTCVTCHYAHGGQQPYFARLDFSKKLCIKCHSEGYDF